MRGKELFKAPCPTCNGERTCFSHGRFEDEWEWTDGTNYVNGAIDHRLLQCCGCETVFYYRGSWNDSDWDEGPDGIVFPVTVRTYPKPLSKKKPPEWVLDSSKIEPQLAMILAEMYGARRLGSYILASIGLRTAFDRASELLGVATELSFESKVKTLLEKGFIGESEAKVLSLVADAGNAAAHRGWSPGEEEFEGLLAVLEHFLERNIATGLGILKLASSIPKRPARAARSKPQ